MSGWSDPQKGGRAVGAALHPTLSSLLSTAPKPGMRATASDAPGSMLYASGGKWAGDPGRFASDTDANYAAYLAAIAAGSVFPAPEILVGPTPATAVAMTWQRVEYIDALPKSVVIAQILSSYRAQNQSNMAFGENYDARASLPISDNIPTITGSSQDPATDPTNPTAKTIYLCGTPAPSDPLTLAEKTALSYWASGWNPNLRAYPYAANALRLSETVGGVGSTGNQGQDATIDPGATWGISAGVVQVEFDLTGDAFCFRQGTGAPSPWFEIHVDGSIVTTATVAGSAAFTSAARAYSITTQGHYAQILFPSSKKRRILVRFIGLSAPSVLWIRATSTIQPAPKKLRWLHFGDSFSQYTISDASNNYKSCSFITRLMGYFGFSFDFVNCSIGGTSLSNTAQILPSTPIGAYTNAYKPSIRKALQLLTGGLYAHVVTAAIGHNDCPTAYQTALFRAELEGFIDDVRRMHPGSVLLIFGTFASPGTISDGSDLGVEGVISQICSEKRVAFIPMQSGASKLLTGTGKLGSPTGAGNSDILVGPDGTHPTGAASIPYASFFASHIVDKLQSL